MIRLGLRLSLKGGREAAVRLAVTVAAVAIGVGLLLTALAGVTAIGTQNARSAWLNTQDQGIEVPGAPKGAPPPVGSGDHAGTAALSSAPVDPLWFVFAHDHFGGKTIDRIDVAATGLHSPVPPGLRRLPAPGQYDVSPALDRLLHSTPADMLADRFPGYETGTIGPAGLPAPDSLVVVVGHTPAQLSGQPDAEHITAFNTDPAAGGPNGFDNSRLQVILAVAALALFFPVLVFIGTATRLAAARREQRFAAMRLVGATPRQVSVISAVESSVAAVGGVAIGFVAFLALRPALTHLDITGQRFASGDLSLSVVDVVLVAIGVPLAAAVAARVAMRRVHISPLAVTRRVTPPAPSATRLLPLVAGVLELGYFVAVGHPKSTGTQIEAYLSGCFLVLAGLLLAGPWLTMIGSRLLARRTRRPAVLLAGRRLADNPRASFRAISGLIIALFVTSVSVGIITTILDYQGSSGGPSAGAALLDQFQDLVGPRFAGPADGGPPSVVVTPAQLAALRSLPGVLGVTTVAPDPSAPSGPNGNEYRVLALCSQLRVTPALGRCRPGASVAELSGNLSAGNLIAQRQRTSLADTVWPAASTSARQVARLAPIAVVVQTDGSRRAVDQARTALARTWPTEGSPPTLREVSDESLRNIVELQQLTNVVILVSLVIAGCSLAVSVTAGVNDRKRPFSLLRLTGVSVGVLRRVVAVEAGAPLLVIAVLAVGLGFLSAGLFLSSQLNQTLQPPKPDFYALVVAGLVASLAIVAATLPLIERITGPEVARND